MPRWIPPLLILVVSHAAPRWADAASRLHLVAPSELASGATMETSAELELEEGILGWSIAVSLHRLLATAATADGTDIEPLVRDGFVEIQLDAGGTGYASVGVLSFSERTVLPAGRWEVLRATCVAAGEDPGTAALIPRDDAPIPGEAGAVRNEVLLPGGALLPLRVERKQVNVLGCAGLRLAIISPSPNEGAPLSLPPDGIVEVEVVADVKSDLHLHPSGLAVAFRHDPSLLRIEATEIPDGVASALVRDDGIVRILATAGEVAATISAPAGSGRVLTTGTHPVLRVSYRFLGSGEHGTVFSTTLRFAGDPSVPGDDPPNAFLPSGAAPCELGDLPLLLAVVTDRWIRGDGNGDARVDLSDTIAILQHLFMGQPANCKRAMEVDLNGKVDLSDAIHLLLYLFLGGPAPAPPFPSCGVAEDILPCDVPACPAS